MIAMTERALKGCGDSALGEWREQGNAVYHLRRRLTPQECAIAGDLTARDIRGTDEGRKRLSALFHDAPHLEQIARQIGEFA
jgi:hypothetical protein